MEKVFPEAPGLYNKYALKTTTLFKMIVPPQAYYLRKILFNVLGHYYVPFLKVDLFISCKWHNLWCLNLIGCWVDDNKFKQIIEGKDSYPNIAVL
jgi:hypothetical protein